MKFSTREDIEAPVDHVFAEVSDFAGFERRALRHGADITRLDEGPCRVGSSWDILFTFRQRERRMRATLVELDAPHHYRVDAMSDGLTVTTNVELVRLSRGRTRVSVAMDLRAKSLTARLLLQSMKLAKVKLNKRFKARIVEFAEDIEDAYRKAG